MAKIDKEILIALAYAYLDAETHTRTASARKDTIYDIADMLDVNVMALQSMAQDLHPTRRES